MRAPEFWTTGAGPWPALLSPLGCLYAAVGRIERGLVRPLRAPIPVLCVGNLTAGGTGKTPVALALARRLQAMGHNPGFLSRGYGGTAPGPLRVDPARHTAGQVGDEPLLLAARAPTWVARQRRAALDPMIEAGIDAVILDDGYQDPALGKDLALVVTDGETGFGNGRVIPAGPLRETVADGLARAGAVIIMGADRADVRERISEARPELPVIAASLVPDDAARALAGRRVYGFAGIGRPEKFAATLEEIGAEVQGFEAFSDHHPYSADDLFTLLGAAAAADALPVTTAKDWVRLPEEVRSKVTVVGVEAAFADADALDALLSAALAASAAPEAPDRGA
ncbi:MAG: tetraacyldisaccharide 4'-kinase [Alphaproteobacteria bacterium]|nr:tetraacyldisaccharide 4'-kinase [Alphaproteobacteria bacterium]